MKAAVEILRQNSARLLVVVIIGALFWATQLPVISAGERAALARQFHFTQTVLPQVAGRPNVNIRQVNPSLQNIVSWISSVGAAVALNDLDGDALPNDVCYVDTRTNQVTVAPVPGTVPRYQAFALAAAPLPYDEATMAPTGCLPGDLNEDGLLDVVVYYWGRTPIAFLRLPPSASGLDRASYQPVEIIPSGGRWFTNAATMADIDGDGHTDLVIGNYFPDGAHILDTQATNQEFMQDSMSRAFNGGDKHFLLWNAATAGSQPSVSFQDARSGLSEQVLRGWTLALAAADLNGDLLPEIYIGNDFGPDRLLYNASRPGQLRFTLLEGEKGFTSPNSKVLGHDSFKGMGVDFGDLNGDGKLDLFVSNITTEFALQESNFAFINTGAQLSAESSIAPFVDQSEPMGVSRSGWAWDARMGDFNNDGVPELIQATGFVKGNTNRWADLHELAMGNDFMVHLPGSWLQVQSGDDLAGHQPNPFFVRSASGRYFDLAADLGLNAPDVSRGIATADVDGDGLLDFAVANQWENSRFYHNRSPKSGSFLGLRLLLPVGQTDQVTTRVVPGYGISGIKGRAAIGAQATVVLPNGRRLVAQVDGGNGHSGKRSHEILFGLDQLPLDAPIQVELSWRDVQGQLHREQLMVRLGWNTIVLAS
ncbi:MAG: CRTAC1 family protein [Roseiflexaceae bacterium]